MRKRLRRLRAKAGQLVGTRVNPSDTAPQRVHDFTYVPMNRPDTYEVYKRHICLGMVWKRGAIWHASIYSMTPGSISGLCCYSAAAALRTAVAGAFERGDVVATYSCSPNRASKGADMAATRE